MPMKFQGAARSAASPVDQLLSSVSNGVVLLAMAAVSTIDDFGTLSLLFTLAAAAIGILRGALGTPLLLSAGEGTSAIRHHGRHAVVAALVAGVLGAPVLLVAGAALGHPAFGLLLALALPIILMQDTLRYCAIALGRAHVAVVWDGLWCAGSVAALLLAWWHPVWLTAAWLLAGWVVFAVASLIGLGAALRVVPEFSGTWRWVRADLRGRIRYGVDAGLEQVAFFAVLLIGTVVIGSYATAALRGATAALAPVAILGSSIPLLVIPAAIRSGKQPREIWRSLTKLALFTSVCSVVAGLVLYLLPAHLGHRVLGESFDVIRDVVLIVAAEYAATGWLLVIGVYLRSQNRSAEVVRLRSFAVCATLVGSLVGALVIGSPAGLGAFYLIATILSVGMALVWFTPWRESPWQLGRGRSGLGKLARESTQHVTAAQALAVRAGPSGAVIRTREVENHEG
ncbi:hypothetical protein IA539_18155 [Gordonia sp. zg691]|uniref:hypothetical protein n=1 Tax=Gordonia jinghuaiqii TaxID=2758710 RepID=UPI00166228A7|nr:hypothetical protein [Gordonia jinghuaiqii]MBD0863109.1 hypothetical protein [Gordonia jinghuaiqii]